MMLSYPPLQATHLSPPLSSSLKLVPASQNRNTEYSHPQLKNRLGHRLFTLSTRASVRCLMIMAGLLPLRAAADVVLDTFERNAIAPWTFYNGAEFPGATGSLNLGTGHQGKGALLSYDLSRGGQYVSANLNLASPINAAAVSLWLQSPPNIFVNLRVNDSTGQTLQYRLNRPVSTISDPKAWYQQIVALNAPESSWGGANDGTVHPPISQIAILAADPPEAGPKGSIGFDDVVAISAINYTLNPSASVVPGSSRVGDMFSNLGVAIHFTRDDRALDAVASAGFGWIRTDLFWSDIETSAGVYNWTEYDALVAALQRRNLHALFILDYGHPLYTETWSSPPITPAAIQAFGNFAEAAARHFSGKGVRFEVWNEANETKGWSSAQYAALAKQALARVHRGDPSAKVSTTGVAGFDFPFIRGYLNAGGGTGADAIGVHPYDVSTPPADLVEKYLYFQGILASYYPSVPAIWNTEWGFSSTDFSTPNPGNGNNSAGRKRQAVLAVRELLSSHAVGFPLSIYYDLRDDGTDASNREHNFGLLANNYSEKPAMTAVKTLARFTRGRTLAGLLPTSPTNLVALRFDGPNDKVFVLWLSTAGSSATVAVPSGATVATLLGSSISPQNGRVVVRETDGPIYITTR